MNVAPQRNIAHEEMPQFINKVKQHQARQLPPPERERTPQITEAFEEDFDVPFSVRMIEYLWPTLFWFMALFNIAVMTVAVFNIYAEGYAVWIHLQAGIVTVALTGFSALIHKWILNGPDGWPGFSRRLSLEPPLKKTS